MSEDDQSVGEIYLSRIHWPNGEFNYQLKYGGPNGTGQKEGIRVVLAEDGKGGVRVADLHLDGRTGPEEEGYEPFLLSGYYPATPEQAVKIISACRAHENLKGLVALMEQSQSAQKTEPSAH